MGTKVRLAVVMDPIGHIKYAKDTTFAMLQAAQARGWSLHYLEQADLRLRDGVAEGNARALTVRADPTDWYRLGRAGAGAPGWLRRDPDAQGSAVRYRIHLYELHPRAG